MKFFKIITVPDANKLRIPAEFMRRYGDTLPDTVSVQVPDGPLWNVKLTKSNGETWLENGWHKFRDYHSVTMGLFLLFAYNGSSGFDVLIFDRSNTEIQYEVSSCFDSGEVKKEIKENIRDDTGLKMPIVDKDKSKAYKKALAFKSDNAGHNAIHISLMQPSYVAGGYGLNLPVSFARESFRGKSSNLTIRAPNGKTWTVKCSVDHYGHAKFSSGWKTLVKENELKVGDVCVFEVMKNAKATWSMTIFRV